MRMFSKALALLGTTGALVVGAAAPASAGHVCKPDDQVCVVTDVQTIPVGTPTVSPLGTSARAIPLTAICLPTCETVYLVVPGAYVSSTGTTVTTITVPEFGVRVDSTGFPYVYGGFPTATPLGGPTPLGLTVVAQVPYLPVWTVNINNNVCTHGAPTTVGPVTLQSSSCITTITVAL